MEGLCISVMQCALVKSVLGRVDDDHMTAMITARCKIITAAVAAATTVAIIDTRFIARALL